MNKIIKGISKDRLAEMWCELNRWEIPSELKNEIKEHVFQNSDKGALAMKEIERIVGKNECLKKWNDRPSEEMSYEDESECS